MIQKMNMKRFLYFFVFFLLLILGFFYMMNTMGARTVQKSLSTASKNQMSYAQSIIDGVISEASMYAIQYTADDSVRFYHNQKISLSAYDSQMAKNMIKNRLNDVLLSSHSIEEIFIYWLVDEEFITTSHDPFSRPPFDNVTNRGWQIIDGSLYYFSINTFKPQPTEIQYIVSVKLKMDYLAGLLEKAINSESSNAFFLMDDHLIISNKPVEEGIGEEVKKTVTPLPNGIETHHFQSKSGEYYILSSYLEPIDTYLVTYTRLSDFLNPLKRNRQAFYFSVVIILIIGLYVIHIFYRNFYRNVYLLNKKFYQVEQGIYSARITEKSTDDFYYLFKSFNFMVAQIQSLFTSLKKETELRRNAEVKQLQAQINPHFLYNSLFFIMSMAKSSPDAVMQMSKHLAEYYRYMTRLESRETTFASELELAEHYLVIMSLCKNIAYSIELPPQLGKLRIMPLMIQPIVENAIQHGIESQQGAHRVAINVEPIPSGVQIQIADDGKGLSEEEIRRLEARLEQEQPPEGTKGIGLWNIHHRLKNVYGDLSGLLFSINEWGGLTVTVKIDFSMNEGGKNAIADS